MLKRVARSVPVVALIPVALFAGACAHSDDGGVRVPDDVPATLAVVSGDEQTGIAGERLAQPLVVRLTGADDEPVAGALVVFRVVEGGGEAYAGAALSDEDGLAREVWILGTDASVPQRLEARAVDRSGEPVLFGAFTADAIAGPAVSLDVAPDSVRFTAVGDTLRPTVVARDRHDNVVDDAPDWTSRDADVARVEQEVVFTTGPGATWLVAHRDSAADSVRVVVEQIVDRLRIQPRNASLPIGDSMRFEARALDANGNQVAGVEFTWLASDPSIATVDATGLVHAVADGVARIRVRGAEKTWSVPITVTPNVVLAAGDVAGCAWQGDEHTALVLAANPDGSIIIPGDVAYPAGRTIDFANCYDPSWGAFRDRTRPVPGNHEYRTEGAAPYFAYFGAAAGEPGHGYYSFDLGNWHIVGLNSNIPIGPGSEQEQWLRADLEALDPASACILAFWHHPLHSSGGHGSTPRMATVWRILMDAGADVVVSGHDHMYERFQPMDDEGAIDVASGLRSFIVGTGGAPLRPDDGELPLATGSVVREVATHGVLRLELGATSYRWEFLPVAGATFTDSGVAGCRTE